MLECPNCGSKENFIGHEVQGVYDGALYWICDHCDFAFPRAFKFEDLNTLSQRHAKIYNTRIRLELED